MSRASELSLPLRPAGVPEGARYNGATRSWSVGEWDAAGRPHGRHQIYGQLGALEAERGYQHGQLEGDFVEWHPNGDVARRGSHRAGQLEGDCIRYNSRQPTPQLLRACCVPPGAWSMRSRFAAGRCLYEHFYDEAERRLLDDGSLFPPLPPNVPSTSHFDSKTRRWWIVEFDAKGQRHGDSRWWLEAGQLDERCGYAEGKRHGVWEKFDGDRLLRRVQYEHGVLQGACFEVTGEHEDSAIVMRRGQYEEGKPAGPWRFEDAAGQEVCQCDLGAVCLRLPPDLLRTECELGAEGEASVPSRVRLLRALRDLGHALWRGEAGPELQCERARQLLRGVSPRLQPAVTEARIRALRNESIETEVRLAALLDLLVCGGTPVTILREMGTYLIEHPELGLDLVALAVALEPSRIDALASRALLAIEVGHCELARHDIAALGPHQPEVAAQIEFTRCVLFAPLDFVPGGVELNREVSEELPSAVEQPLEIVLQAMSRLVARLQQVQRALDGFAVLREQPELGEFWPAQWTAMEALPQVALEDYSFVSEVDGESDTILVREKLELAGKRPSELLARARLDWGALCWLCWGVGLDEVAVPSRILPRPDFGRALGTAFSRVWRARDRLETMGLRARKQGAPPFAWRGVSIDALAPRWVHNVRDEYVEMRAALFFLGDASCRSLWQDDLRV